VLDDTPGPAPDGVSWRSSSSPRPLPPGVPFPGATALFPTSAHLMGKLGASFTTDVRLFNTDASNPRSVALSSTRLGGLRAPSRSRCAARPGRSTTSSATPSARMATDLLLSAAFRRGRSRTTTTRCAAALRSLDSRRIALRGGRLSTTLTLLPVFRGTGFRVNIGLAEVTGNEAVRKSPQGRARRRCAVLPEKVSGGALLQSTTFTRRRHPARRLGPLRSACPLGRRRVVVFATPVDDSSNDGAFSGARSPAAPAASDGRARQRPARSALHHRREARECGKLSGSRQDPSIRRRAATFSPSS